MPRTGLRQRPNRGRHRVLTRRRAALHVRGESKPGADHGLQSQDARVPRWIWIVGLRKGTVWDVAPLVRGFEGQSVHGGSDPPEAREQTGPEVHLHWFCTHAGGDQEQVAIGDKLSLRSYGNASRRLLLGVVSRRPAILRRWLRGSWQAIRNESEAFELF